MWKKTLKKTDNTNGVKKTSYVFFVENGKKISILTRVQLPPRALEKKRERKGDRDVFVLFNIPLSLSVYGWDR